MLSAKELNLIVTEGTSLEVQWLRLCASTAKSMHFIPDWETKILLVTQSSQDFFKKRRKSLKLPGESTCHTPSSHCLRIRKVDSTVNPQGPSDTKGWSTVRKSGRKGLSEVETKSLGQKDLKNKGNVGKEERKSR